MLLATKCFLPPLRAGFVARPRLVEKLDAGLTGRLILVAAPAGFGKSKVVSHWLQSHEGAGARQRGWLSLDKEDNDPARFFDYLCLALQQALPQLESTLRPLLQATPLPPLETIATLLVNELVDLASENAADDLILVLDDYHLIEQAAIHDAVAFLLEHSPPHFHLVLITRADPPLPLARWRVRRELTELRAADLRFTAAEVTTLFNDQLQFDLSVQQIAELEQRTEGWAAALQLATVSMQGRDDPSAFIASFSGSHHFVLDYLTEEVLNRQPAPRRDFLLRTAILDRFSAALSTAVLTDVAKDEAPSTVQLAVQEHETQRILEELDGANLFILRLDDERRWYRYHHLFGEFLRKRLHEQCTEKEIRLLYRRAAEWCDRAGYDEEAIHYALQSGDRTLVMVLMRKHIPTLLGRSELHKALRWLTAMARAGFVLPPQFQLWHAWALFYSGQIERLLPLLVELERTAANVQKTAPEYEEIAGNLAALRGWLALFAGNHDEAIELASMALETLPTEEQFVRATCYANLGYAYLLEGKLPGAVRAFQAATVAAEQSGNLLIAIFAASFLANAYLQQGDLYGAERLYRSAIAQATAAHQRYSPAAGVAYIGLAELLREWYRLEEAAELIERAIELSEQSHSMTILTQALPAKARIQLAQSDVQGALSTLERSDSVAHALGLAQQPENNNALRAWINLRVGNREAALHWAAQQPLPDLTQPTLESYRSALLLGAIWGAGGAEDAARALDLLTAVKTTAQTNGYAGVALQATILQALAHRTLRNQDAAFDCLEQALAAGAAQGYVAQFMRGGPAMQQLLQLALPRSAHSGYIHKLLTVFPGVSIADEISQQPAAESGQIVSAQAQPLIEPLSARELEVLALLADGSSNAEIADQLIITVGTTKRHVSNIYGKLGVGSRTQAVAYAREIGLL